MLETIERTTGPNPTHSVIWLHGLGADGHDFEPVVPELAHPDLPDIRFVFPHAPVRPVTLNQGMSMRAWFDLYGLDRDAHEDIDGIRTTRHAVTDLIAREAERGIPQERIVLAGFSQGCAMALYTGLRLEHRLAGLIGLSGYLPLRNTLAAELHPANAATPIFMAHGTDDMVVPLAFAETSRDAMTRLGCAVEWHTYPMPHGLHPQELDDIRMFLVRVLG
ncbi:dienelactone hydrolase family protein [Castellaniella sp. MT123]|uniref:alpha/beta hydrolase n=1 Tax=Castellaniella sp. MT123 TaxID=3140381 RepID=UPI0031F40966|nr:dienelactone hydrolase family protein [Castellaniella sp.]